jgi:hypothetical protein
MVKIFGKFYYINVDNLVNKCTNLLYIESEENDKEEKEEKEENVTKETSLVAEMNIFKYELLKMCVDRVLNDAQEDDDEMGIYSQKNYETSFQIAFNTLIKYNIITDDDE